MPVLLTVTLVVLVLTFLLLFVSYFTQVRECLTCDILGILSLVLCAIFIEDNKCEDEKASHTIPLTVFQNSDLFSSSGYQNCLSIYLMV